jgi:hypothetical protein
MPRSGQQHVEISLLARMTELKNRDNVACDIRATLNSGLEGAFDSELGGEVVTKLGLYELLMLLQLADLLI